MTMGAKWLPREQTNLRNFRGRFSLDGVIDIAFQIWHAGAQKFDEIRRQGDGSLFFNLITLSHFFYSDILAFNVNQEYNTGLRSRIYESYFSL